MIYNIKGIDFTYPNGRRKILDNVSLKIKEGEILSVLGPNGAGKTTLLSCMAGLLNPICGSIEICGKDIQGMKPREIANIVAYVPQIHTPAFDYTVFDFVLMGRAPKFGVFSKPSPEDKKFCEETLEQLGILEIANRSYQEISGGERQQALIARALVQEPKIILFDEPTAHLDYGNQHRTLKLIKKMADKGYGIVITTHNPDHALLLEDRAAIVNAQGQLQEGKTREIITEKNLIELYQTEIRLIGIKELERTACLVERV